MSFVAFGSFKYVQNVVVFGDPIGPAKEGNERDSAVYPSLVRTTWNFVETPGVTVPVLRSALEDGLPKLLGDQTNSAFKGFAPDTAYSEDRSAFGYVGWLVFLPLLAYCLLAPGMPGRFRTIAAASVLYLVAFALFKRYDEFVGRLLLPMVALGFPLVALLYRRRVLFGLVSVLALLPLFPVLFENPNKPLLDKGRGTNVFGLDRTQQQALARPSFKPVIPRLNRIIGAKAPLGVVGSLNSYYYPYFGSDLDRRVVILQPDQATPHELRNRGLAGAILTDLPRQPADAVMLSPGYWFIRAAKLASHLSLIPRRTDRVFRQTPLSATHPRANRGRVPDMRLSEGSQPATAYGGLGRGFSGPGSSR